MSPLWSWISSDPCLIRFNYPEQQRSHILYTHPCTYPCMAQLVPILTPPSHTHQLHTILLLLLFTLFHTRWTYWICKKFLHWIHRYLLEVDCSLDQFKSAKLKYKKYPINAPFSSKHCQEKRWMQQILNICWWIVSC